MAIRAHYDGRVIVPDEPVDLPVNEKLEVELRRIGGDDATPARTPLQEAWEKQKEFIQSRMQHSVPREDRTWKREDAYE